MYKCTKCGVATVSLYEGGRVILEEQVGTFTGTYTYGVSFIRRSWEFFMYDGLGSARTFTNNSGVVNATTTYDVCGITVTTSGSTVSHYQFGATSGYRCDGDAGIMQVGARYYDPATGSFLTRDTDLNQLAYVYCGDDPIDRLDPSGHGPIHWRNVAHDVWVGFFSLVFGAVGGKVGGAIGAPGGPEGIATGTVIGGIIGGL